MSRNELLAKYDVPVPRYTSYPTVPYWENNISTASWLTSVTNTLAHEDSAWAMYLHIPYCESLCTFCGCNTRVTRTHTSARLLSLTEHVTAHEPLVERSRLGR